MTLQVAEFFEQVFPQGGQFRSASRGPTDLPNQQRLPQAILCVLEFSPYGTVTHLKLFGGRMNRTMADNRRNHREPALRGYQERVDFGRHIHVRLDDGAFLALCEDYRNDASAPPED